MPNRLTSLGVKYICVMVRRLELSQQNEKIANYGFLYLTAVSYSQTEKKSAVLLQLVLASCDLHNLTQFDSKYFSVFDNC